MKKEIISLSSLAEEIRKLTKAAVLQKLMVEEDETTPSVTEGRKPPSLAEQASDVEEQPPSQEKLINRVSSVFEALKKDVDELQKTLEKFKEEWDAAINNEDKRKDELNDLVGEGWFLNTAAALKGKIDKVSETGKALRRNLINLGKLLWEELDELREVRVVGIPTEEE